MLLCFGFGYYSVTDAIAATDAIGDAAEEDGKISNEYNLAIYYKQVKLY